MLTSTAAIPVVHFPEGWYLAAPQFLAATARAHGPIFRRILGDRPTGGQEHLYLVGPEANRFVLYTHREYFSHDLGWTPLVGEWAGKGLLNMDPPEHTRHRKLWNPAFTAACMAQYLPIMEHAIRRRIDAWAERGEVDLFAEAREVTFEVAARALAGLDGPEIGRLRELFYALLHGYDERVETWGQFVERRRRIVAELHAIVLALIAERRSRPPEATPQDVLSLIVQARDENGQPLSDQQVVDHLKILLVAGHEMTTTLGAWLLYLLATHPAYLTRVRQELARVLPGSASAISFEALRAMRVLDNAVREAGRLHPPVVAVPRGVLADVEFAGHVIPAGAQVWLALGATHHLPDLFAHPERFDPDRFEPPREEERRNPFALVTFGGGPRICIGMHFAHVEAKLLAASVFRAYDLQPVPERPVVEIGFVTSFLPNGIWARVTPRPSPAP